jgi:hypothetical protein
MSYYGPKEHQFLRCWTRTYRNLGANTTQRNEGYHRTTKRSLSRNLPLYKAVEVIVKDLEALMTRYLNNVNRDRRKTSTLLDKTAFGDVGELLSSYALDLTMQEWREAKKLASDSIFVDTAAHGCELACELPCRYALPCRHWMLPAVELRRQLPLSLFHPRWLLDGPAVLHDLWKMSWEEDNARPRPDPTAEAVGDRFKGKGEEMLQEVALTALDVIRELPAPAAALAEAASGAAEPDLSQESEAVQQLFQSHGQHSSSSLPLLPSRSEQHPRSLSASSSSSFLSLVSLSVSSSGNSGSDSSSNENPEPRRSGRAAKQTAKAAEAAAEEEEKRKRKGKEKRKEKRKGTAAERRRAREQSELLTDSFEFDL